MATAGKTSKSLGEIFREQRNNQAMRNFQAARRRINLVSLPENVPPLKVARRRFSRQIAREVEQRNAERKAALKTSAGVLT